MTPCRRADPHPCAALAPLLQIPADMLLMHIFIPFTVEHVRVKGAVKAAVQAWLRLVARWVLLRTANREGGSLAVALAHSVLGAPCCFSCGHLINKCVCAWAVRVAGGRALNWSEYLLPPEPRHAAEVRAQQQAAQEQQLQAAAVQEAAAAVPAGQPDTAAAQEGQGTSASALQQQQQQEALAAVDPAPQQEEGRPLLQAGSVPQQPPQLVVAPSQQQQQHPQPVQWFESQGSYGWKVLGLVLALLATMVVLNTLLLTLPVGVGRALFTALRLPFKNDLFTGMIGLIVLSGGYTFAAAVASSASVMNLRAVAAAAWRWSLLMGQCAVLLVLWLGVVATMLGMLCELVLLPLRLPPNQTALIYLYQVRQEGAGQGAAVRVWPSSATCLECWGACLLGEPHSTLAVAGVCAWHLVV